MKQNIKHMCRFVVLIISAFACNAAFASNLK